MKIALKILGLLLLLGSGIRLFNQASLAPQETDSQESMLVPMPPPPEKGKAIVDQRRAPAGKTIAARFPTPEGYERVTQDSTSFAYYLRHFPLLPVGSPVRLYDGSLKGRQDVHAAVLDIDVGQRDLQQCADAIMRLRAEYLRGSGQSESISFNFTNGFPAEYSRWKRGERISVKGNSVYWVPGSNSGNTAKEWQRYLNMVFSYAGTLSLDKELQPVPLQELQIGDVFIKGGSPGHAVIVVDRAVNKSNGDVAFLLAQSYMPAQNIHVLNNPGAASHQPWYFVSQIKEKLITPEWVFDQDQLKRF